MDAAVQTVRRLGVDRIAVQNEAPERHLDVAAGAAEPVVKVEMPEGRIQVVAPEQATTRRPSQTHSRLPAGALRARCASANSSLLLTSLAPSLAGAGCWSAGLASLFCANT